MSAVDTTGIGQAIGALMTKRILDITSDGMHLVAMLAGLDQYYNRNAPGNMPTIRKGKVGGGVYKGKMRSRFLTEKPKWQWVDAMDPVIANRELELVKRVRVIQGGTMCSAIQFGEPFDKYELAILEDEEGLKDWEKMVARMSAQAFWEQINDALFPDFNQVGGAGQIDGNIAKIMAFAYPLQSGFLGNMPTAQGNEVYMYQNIDLNKFPRFKAVNVGTDAAAYTYTWEKFRFDVVMKLRSKRNSKCDLCIHGSDTFEATKTQLSGTIQQKPDKVVALPGEFFVTNDGVFHMLETAIDKLPKREIYVGSSDSLAFGLPDDPMEGVHYIDPYPGLPTMAALEGMSLVGFINERPWEWGRAYNVVLP